MQPPNQTNPLNESIDRSSTDQPPIKQEENGQNGTPESSQEEEQPLNKNKNQDEEQGKLNNNSTTLFSENEPLVQKEPMTPEQIKVRRQGMGNMVLAWLGGTATMAAGAEMPLVGGSVFIPTYLPFMARTVVPMLHPVATLAGTALATGLTGAYQLFKAIPESQLGGPSIFGNVNPR